MRIVVDVTAFSDNAAQICAGIRGYLTQHRLGWEVVVCNRCRGWDSSSMTDPAPESLAGAIFVGCAPSPLRLRLAQELPRVVIGGNARLGPEAGHRRTVICADDLAVGEMAARHVHAVGYRQAAVLVGLVHDTSKERRCRAYLATCRSLGLQALNLKTDLGEIGLSREEALGHQLDWLATQQVPTAVFFHQDVGADWWRSCCHVRGLSLPDPVGIIGVDNAVQFCEVGDPALTSIELPYRYFGQTAMLQLHRLISGDPPPDEPVVIPPLRVVARASTALQGHLSPLVTKALARMRRTIARPIDTRALAQELGVGMTTLWRAFQADLGNAPKQVQRQIRLQAAERRLLETDDDLRAIARACGFANEKSFGTAFAKNYGMPPGRFRDMGRT